MTAREPDQSGAEDWPPEVIEAGAAILRALSERAAARGRVHEMLKYLAAERRLLEEAPHG